MFDGVSDLDLDKRTILIQSNFNSSNTDGTLANLSIEVLKGSYCDWSMSVLLRTVSTICFKSLLLHPWAN